MKIKQITIQNYKGIKHIEIPFEFKNGSYITTPITLLGLNESGKTSVLRAINFLVENVSYDTIQQDIVPKDKKSTFNSSISVEVILSIDKKDERDIMKKIEGYKNFIAVEGSISQELKYSKKIVFEKGNINEDKSSLGSFDPDLDIRIKKSKSGKKEYKLKDEMDKIDIGEYNKIFEDCFPNIVLFETLNSKTPDRIYLDDHKENSNRNKTYKDVFESLFSICEPEIDLSEIRRRITSAKRGNRDDDGKTRQTIKKVQRKLNEDVVAEWGRIFNVQLGDVKTEINWGVEKRDRYDEDGEIFKNDDDSTEKIDIPYVEITIEHGDSEYKIQERSLGFNWFFTFLALVYFKGQAGSRNNRQNVFLLDEPASNLHSGAQGRLLKKIEDIVNEKNIVIYSTHSQYLINPKWFSNTYVIKNAAITDIGADTNKSADITMTRYNDFVGNAENKSTHFQPALDAIDYRPSQLEMVGDTIMVEGKNDFFTLKYLIENYIQDEKLKDICILPCAGADTLDLPIQLYLAWGRKFVVLLDADRNKAGENAKERYVKNFGENIRKQIFTFDDILNGHQGSMESIFTATERMRIIKTIYPDESQYTKNKFNKAIEQMYATDEKIKKDRGYDLIQSTKKKFETILSFLNKKLQGENDPTINN